MNKNRWLLPEGIEEVLPPQAKRVEAARRRILDIFDTWGYEMVITPVIEYTESLLSGADNDLDLKTFKLIDQLSGRMMGVRADITPQVARIDAHHLRRDEPTRLCYLGTVLHTRPDSHGGSRSPLQIGAELYGHGGIESDVEVIRLMLEALRGAGFETIHLDLGHVGIFRALACQAGLGEEDEARLFDALQRKAGPEIQQLLEALNIAPGLRAMLGALVELNGGAEVLERAAELMADTDGAVQAALENLRRIAATLSEYDDRVQLHFDLAELRGYHYHTGIVFAAFAPGCGQAIAQGGRYDDIGEGFGRARPATGFSADLKVLMDINPHDEQENRGIFAPFGSDPALVARVEALRSEGHRVICALPGQLGGAREMGCDQALELRDGNWELVAV